MALLYHPKLGEILLCDYRTGFMPPEMVKRRPVVIISPRLRRRNDLVTVVPLSTTTPAVVEAYHCRIILAVPLPPPFDSATMWAKCDMLATLSLARLDRFRVRKDASEGARRFVSGMISHDQLRDVRTAMLSALGLEILTNQLRSAR